MSALAVPDTGLLLESSANSSDHLPLQAFGITLSDSVIEDMIKCVQGGQEIELTLGSTPSFLIGSREQKVKTTPDSYNYDLYLTKPEEAANKAQRLLNPTMSILKQLPSNIISNKTIKSKSKDVKRGVKSSKPLPPGKSAMASVLSNSATRSLPSSPALNGVSSPNPAFSASQQLLEKNKNQRTVLVHELASRDQTFEHLADVWKGTEADLKPTVEKVANFDAPTKKWSLKKIYWKELDVWNYDYRNDDRAAAIENAIKQYDKQRISTSAPEWEKLLAPSERGKGIVLSKLQTNLAKGNLTPVPRVSSQKTDDSGNKSDADASKAKGEAMARSNSQPVGNKTKKVSEREAQTKRLFSTSTKKPAPKKPAPKPKPITTEEKGRKFLSEEKVIDSESSGDERPLSSTTTSSAPRPKPIEKPVEKPIEKIAEKLNERRIEKPAPKAVEKPKEKPKERPAPVTLPKPKPVVRAPRPPIKASAPISQKRGREDDDSSSSSGAPLSKRIKPKELPKPLPSTTALKHRPSDASQSSRNAVVGTGSSNFSKSKNTSPAKSSPLASSPPTNASDIEEQEKPPQRKPKPQARSGERETNGMTNGGGSLGVQNKKRKERDVDQYSSQQSTPNKKQQVPRDVLVKARMFTKFYERYEALHYEISGLKEPPEDKLADLLDMRERLATMKTEISQAVAAH
ncbi:uncharacterized protein GGS22DRAFT_172189 [Annulohypoxylon maeteangense]|uniref:uncharacterized protein n=1 Tax=Annulohypoxylon maeteangense TaxID=1927788 RepID=UPI0020074B6F|nr:uncharacterized protein GGS22DRAFT_172189 [Annulohypoxylon maeteangense]KAI0881450.1 hypothetical protein GGS22DRAFT_172189 [Annulohypoxylon maeteangense]